MTSCSSVSNTTSSTVASTTSQGSTTAVNTSSQVQTSTVSTNTASGGDANKVYIGVVAGVTGTNKTVGGFVKNGCDMAVEEINAAGGILGKKIELVYADEVDNLQASVNATNMLISDSRVSVIWGSVYSQNGMAVLPAILKAKMPYLTAGSSSQFTNEKNPYVWQTRNRDMFAKELTEVYDLFPKLKERQNQLGWSLSGGEQQMLAIGRALMARPKVLMLDEPSMGLAPVIVIELFDKIVQINNQGIPVLLIEQNTRLAMKISDYTYVLDQGRITLHGKSEDMRKNPHVLKAYLGQFA